MEQIMYPQDYFKEGFFSKTSQEVLDGLTLFCERQNVSKQEAIDHAIREFLESRGIHIPAPDA